jgi:hypothetical protein
LYFCGNEIDEKIAFKILLKLTLQEGSEIPDHFTCPYENETLSRFDLYVIHIYLFQGCQVQKTEKANFGQKHLKKAKSLN